MSVRYAINELKDPVSSQQPSGDEDDDLLEEFFTKIRRKIIHGKEAYLLTDLLRDANSLCRGGSVIPKTCQLKKLLTEKFGDDIAFFISGRNCIVHSSKINPCEYSIATIKGNGLRDDDIIRAFGAMVKRKVKARSEESKHAMNFPFTPEELIDKINDEGPIPEIYNAIYSSLHPFVKKTEQGYAETSSQQLGTKKRNRRRDHTGTVDFLSFAEETLVCDWYRQLC